MIECNQYVLVIPSAGPFFYLLAPEVNFPGDLCVIKQYYLFSGATTRKQISFLSSVLSRRRSVISLFTLIRLRVQ